MTRLEYDCPDCGVAIVEHVDGDKPDLCPVCRTGGDPREYPPHREWSA